MIFDDKPFCCHGCKTVYEILKESDACEYYDIEKHPGIKIKEAEIGQKYAYLDHEEIRSGLLEFSDGGISKVKLFIPSIHCSSCIWLLENLNRAHAARMKFAKQIEGDFFLFPTKFESDFAQSKPHRF